MGTSDNARGEPNHSCWLQPRGIQHNARRPSILLSRQPILRAVLGTAGCAKKNNILSSSWQAASTSVKHSRTTNFYSLAFQKLFCKCSGKRLSLLKFTNVFMSWPSLLLEKMGLCWCWKSRTIPTSAWPCCRAAHHPNELHCCTSLKKLVAAQRDPIRDLQSSTKSN